MCMINTNYRTRKCILCLHTAALRLSCSYVYIESMRVTTYITLMHSLIVVLAQVLTSVSSIISISSVAFTTLLELRFWQMK